MITSSYRLISTLGLSFCILGTAQAEPDNDISQLKAKLAELQAQIEQLQQQTAAAQPSPSALPSAPAKTFPATSEIQAGVTTNDAKVTLEGRVHFDYNWFDGAYNAQANGEAGSDWFPRRIRAGLDAELSDWDHSLLLEFGEGTAEIILARVRYNGLPNGIKLQFGKLREDISLNALTSSNNTGLMERSSVADTFSPYFRWGASAYQYHKGSGLRWALGVYKNDAFGASGEDLDGFVTLAYSGRLTWNHNSDFTTVHIGSWYSEREMGGNTLSARLARGEVRQANTRLLDYAAGGSPVALDSLSQAGLEFGWRLNSLTLEAEYARRILHAVNASDPLDGSDQSGYYLSFSYFPQGYERRYSTGNAVFLPPKNIAHAWELAGRFTQMDASSALQGTELSTYTLGVSYYFSSNIKLTANAVYSEMSGPGQIALTGGETSGRGFAARLHYAF